MTEKELNKLLKKYSHGQATPQETDRVNIFFERLTADQDDIENMHVDDSVRIKIYNDIQNKIGEEVKQKTTPTKMYFWNTKNILKIAASISILAIGITYFQLNRPSEPEKVIAVSATYTTKFTTRGQKKTITLKDGTVVKLNSESSLKYPDSFGNDRREVELVGEAYFDVAKDQNRPFIVNTGKIATTALGTSFNIEAYPHSFNTSISLVEGKVRIDNFMDEARSNASNNTFLLPGDNLVYDKATSTLKKGHFDLKKTVSWKDNIIYFEKTRFKDAIHTLELWYGVEFTIVNQATNDIVVNGEFKDEILDNVLKSMSYSKFKYRINDDKIIIEFI